MRIIICGGREFRDIPRIAGVLRRLVQMYGSGITIVTGYARGTDRISDIIAVDMGLAVERFKADWDRYGKAAGPIRNTEILHSGVTDMVVAFPGGKGTANMVEQAVRAGIPVWEPLKE